MKHRINGLGKSPLLAACVLICGLLLAGCDDHVTVIRDPNIPIHKESTWAWKLSRRPKTRPASRCVAGRDLARRIHRSRLRRQ